MTKNNRGSRSDYENNLVSKGELRIKEPYNIVDHCLERSLFGTQAATSVRI